MFRRPTGIVLLAFALEHVKAFDKLHTLELFGSHYRDKGLESLAGMTELRELTLFSTRVTGEGLGQLKGLPKLSVLKLESCPLSKKGLANLKNLKAWRSWPSPARPVSAMPTWTTSRA